MNHNLEMTRLEGMIESLQQEAKLLQEVCRSQGQREDDCGLISMQIATIDARIANIQKIIHDLHLKQTNENSNNDALKIGVGSCFSLLTPDETTDCMLVGYASTPVPDQFTRVTVDSIVGKIVFGKKAGEQFLIRYANGMTEQGQIGTIYPPLVLEPHVKTKQLTRTV